MGGSGGSSVSDDDWDKFLRQAELGVGEAPKEPSARARMVTERLRREDEERARAAGRTWFGRKNAPEPPPGWRTGPAPREKGGRRLKAAVVIVLIAGLALIAVRPELVIDRITGKAGQDGQDGRRQAPLPAESVRPTGPPERMDPDRPTLKEPFRGSPAVQWADGAAGIEVPEAQAAGGVSKEQVAQGLAQVKQFLVLANLDPATLRGDRPEAVLKMIEPRQREAVDRLERALDRPAKETDPLQMFTRIDPAELRLAGDVVKVRGRMTVKDGPKPGQFDVAADYTFVYPLVQVKAGASEVRRTIVRRQMTFAFADPARWQVTPDTMQLGDYSYDVLNSSCSDFDGFLHPSFSDSPDTGPQPSGPPVDPYDRSKDIARDGTDEGCGALSRT
ncbi:hypothetical protein [Streptomyces sp. NPDC090022]|uniref:hypothetical protein n=1 Tax=Streptomyces sp. NPDC090022 TaxID=3365920 RepID=UPI00380C42FA